MSKTAALLVVLSTAVMAQAPPASAPSKPAIYVSNTDLAAAMAKAGAGSGSGMTASNVTNSEHYRINLIRRTQAAGAIVHRPGTELHYIVEGAGTLVTGGSVVRPANGGTSSIEGGVTRRVVKGDAILVPEGTPHQYTAVEGQIVYLEVRFNVPVE
jgi:mannose-6-phosphate isomerase-like protein (cupin superfamily)